MSRMIRVIAALAWPLAIVLDSACNAAPTPPDPLPAEAGSAPTAQAGLPVGSADDVHVEDKERGKSLAVRVTYPESGGPFPLILFSHGASGSKDGYQPLARDWAAHGYVVLQVNHADSGVLDPASAFKAWSSRPPDISALLDHLDDIESQVPQVRGKIDRRHVGVGGHSFGGQTAAMIGGYRLGGGQSYREARVSAVLLLAPPGTAEGDTPRSWADMRSPMLTIVGGLDSGRTGESALWRMEAFRSASAQDDFLIVVDRADHGLGGISGRTGEHAPASEPEQLDFVLEATTLFWDTYLKGNSDACATLASGALVAKSGIATRFESKGGVRVRSVSAPDELVLGTASGKYVHRMDGNGDGVLSRDEVPERLSDQAFNALDRDRDGVLSEEEAQPLAERLATKMQGRDRGASASRSDPATPSMAPITQTTSNTKAVCHPE